MYRPKIVHLAKFCTSASFFLPQLENEDDEGNQKNNICRLLLFYDIEFYEDYCDCYTGVFVIFMQQPRFVLFCDKLSSNYFVFH